MRKANFVFSIVWSVLTVVRLSLMAVALGIYLPWFDPWLDVILFPLGFHTPWTSFFLLARHSGQSGWIATYLLINLTFFVLWIIAFVRALRSRGESKMFLGLAMADPAISCIIWTVETLTRLAAPPSVYYIIAWVVEVLLIATVAIWLYIRRKHQ